MAEPLPKYQEKRSGVSGRNRLHTEALSERRPIKHRLPKSDEISPLIRFAVGVVLLIIGAVLVFCFDGKMSNLQVIVVALILSLAAGLATTGFIGRMNLDLKYAKATGSFAAAFLVFVVAIEAGAPGVLSNLRDFLPYGRRPS